MLLDILGFLHLSFVDIIDILAVAVIIYSLYEMIKGSSAMNIFWAIIILMVIRVLASALNMKMLTALLGTLLDIGAIAIVVIFQPEIRRFLSRMGRGKFHKNASLLDRILKRKNSVIKDEAVMEITQACKDMSDTMTGALIVLSRTDALTAVADTGDRLDADISRSLIKNIFFKNSPLHDGAMIIGGSRIIAARCTLPNTAREDIPSNYGMRHKAAVGLTEICDADVIVVSEQTGRIAFVHDGNIRTVEYNDLPGLIIGDTEKK